MSQMFPLLSATRRPITLERALQGMWISPTVSAAVDAVRSRPEHPSSLPHLATLLEVIADPEHPNKEAEAAAGTLVGRVAEEAPGNLLQALVSHPHLLPLLVQGMFEKAVRSCCNNSHHPHPHPPESAGMAQWVMALVLVSLPAAPDSQRAALCEALAQQPDCVADLIAVTRLGNRMAGVFLQQLAGQPGCQAPLLQHLDSLMAAVTGEHSLAAAAVVRALSETAAGQQALAQQDLSALLPLLLLEEEETEDSNLRLAPLAGEILMNAAKAVPAVCEALAPRMLQLLQITQQKQHDARVAFCALSLVRHAANGSTAGLQTLLQHMDLLLQQLLLPAEQLESREYCVYFAAQIVRRCIVAAPAGRTALLSNAATAASTLIKCFAQHVCSDSPVAGTMAQVLFDCLTELSREAVLTQTVPCYLPCLLDLLKPDDLASSSQANRPVPLQLLAVNLLVPLATFKAGALALAPHRALLCAAEGAIAQHPIIVPSADGGHHCFRGATLNTVREEREGVGEGERELHVESKHADALGISQMLMRVDAAVEQREREQEQ